MFWHRERQQYDNLKTVKTVFPAPPENPISIRVYCRTEIFRIPLVFIKTRWHGVFYLT